MAQRVGAQRPPPRSGAPPSSRGETLPAEHSRDAPFRLPRQAPTDEREPMPLIACPKCSSEDITGTPQADSRLLIHCASCGHEWLRGEARRDPGRPAVRTFDSLHAAFPTAADVRPDVRERVELLVSEFQLEHREPDAAAAAFRAKYKELFSRDGLTSASPDDLVEFVTGDTLAGTGNMSGFNRAWKTQGDDRAAQKVRESIE